MFAVWIPTQTSTLHFVFSCCSSSTHFSLSSDWSLVLDQFVCSVTVKRKLKRTKQNKNVSFVVAVWCVCVCVCACSLRSVCVCGLHLSLALWLEDFCNVIVIDPSQQRPAVGHKDITSITAERQDADSLRVESDQCGTTWPAGVSFSSSSVVRLCAAVRFCWSSGDCCPPKTYSL